MPSTPRLRSLSRAACAAFLVAGCSLSGYRSDPTDASARAATDLPERFLGTAQEPGCRSPLTDPRDGRELRLVRSAASRGDYAVPEGSYGVGAGELLRIDCTTGVAIGIVRR